MHKALAVLGLCACSALAAGVPLASAVPEPSISPISWELRFKYYDPQKISVVVPEKTRPVVYWCMLYTIENPGPNDVEFYPRFELVTDTLQVIQSEVRVSPEAFRAIQRRIGDPLLVTPERAVGRLLVGADRRRHSVAIFKNVDPDCRAFTVYVAGLSGETVRMKNPSFDPQKPESEKNERYFLLRKTLAIPYKLPGGSGTREYAEPERQSGLEKWIMR